MKTHHSAVAELVILGLLAVFLTGCATVTVDVDWDREAAFDRLGSFAVVERGDDRRDGPSPLVERRIQRAITAELNAKGYREVRRSRADFVVVAYAASHRAVRIDRVWYGWRRPYRWGPSGVRVHTYREGSLVIDIIDGSARELIWRGVARGVVNGGSGDDDAVAHAVAKVLREFPPTSTDR